MIGSMIGFAGNYNSYRNYLFMNTGTKEGAVSENTVSTEDKEKEATEKGSIMSGYIRENPQQRAVQESRITKGYETLSEAGFPVERLDNMAMYEFRDAVAKTIRNIPFHNSRPYDEETVVFSEEGWENMKKDTDYLAWAVGFVREERSAENPFAGEGDKGTYSVQSFGEDPDSYRGHSYSKIFGGTAAGARTMYIAQSGRGGIISRAHLADRQPAYDYNIWDQSRKNARKKPEEMREANLQARYQQKKLSAG